MELKVKLDKGAYMIEKAHELDAGYDLKTPEGFVLGPHSSHIVKTGVHAAIPEGMVGMLKSKSGLNVKHDITSDGVIDAGYTGGITVKLYNHEDKAYAFLPGDKVSQLVIMPISTFDGIRVVDTLEGSERGDNGFGSSGR